METVSLIRTPLWDKAKWQRTGYLWVPTNESPPIVALAFGDATAGREIFSHWQREIGKIDVDEQLRLSIIRGISRKNVHAYRVVISANPQMSPSAHNKPKLLFMMSRFHTMEPSSDVNLRTFLESYRIVGRFGFMPALFRGAASPPEVFYDHAIVMRHIQIRDAWEIGPEDLESVALLDDDDPVIPAGIENPPVVQALKRLRER